MIVCDHNFCAFEITQHVAGDQFSVFIVAIRIIWLQDAQPIANRQTRRNHQKATSKVRTPRPPDGVDSLPGDDHRHNRRFARAGRQFQSEAQKLRIRVAIGISDVFEKSLAGFSLVRRNLC